MVFIGFKFIGLEQSWAPYWWVFLWFILVQGFNFSWCLWIHSNKLFFVFCSGSFICALSFVTFFAFIFRGSLIPLDWFSCSLWLISKFWRCSWFFFIEEGRVVNSNDNILFRLLYYFGDRYCLYEVKNCFMKIFCSFSVDWINLSGLFVLLNHKIEYSMNFIKLFRFHIIFII